MRCFREESDFLFYLTSLQRLSEKFECAIHAYCLMSNHIHLLMTPEAAPACAGLMKELSQSYAHYFNKKYERTGTLWEGRFRSCLVESASYVLACYRYIELNPLRGGLVTHPSLYPWSSYGANTGMRQDALVTPHSEFLSLAIESRARYILYGGLLDEGTSASMLGAIRAATAGGYPLVSDEFKAALTPSAGRRLDRGHPGRPPKRREESRKSVPDPDLFSADEAS